MNVQTSQTQDPIEREARPEPVLFKPQQQAEPRHDTPLPGSIRQLSSFDYFVKRTFDVGLTLVLLGLAAPVMLVVAAIIKFSSPGPIFFVQHRVGYRGKHFAFIKFRSMHYGSDDKIHRNYAAQWISGGGQPIEDKSHGEKKYKLVDDPRVFKFGRFIRKYSIDELPQLFNVLRGDMSLVGPRPALPYEVEVYNDWHRRRFEGLPGISGLWQVSGRNKLSFDEMVRLDIRYLETWSVLLDLKILLRTVNVVLREPAN
jgi:lipopolysaccharide/colanic/teichoic acid biosynthesis glycosyltransferase